MSLPSSEINIGAKKVSAVDVSVLGLSVRVKPEVDIRSYVQDAFIHRKSTRSGGSYKTILDDVSVDVPAGSLTAILGSSGSGKTTLLNAIAHRISSKSMDVSGSITFNRGGQLKDVRSAYVVQDDILLPTLTVRETLRYAADLRLSSISTQQERDGVVEDTILELGLKECADTRIGTSANSQCSGGEKRRTSIGVQLLSDPSVLFCDEPTTGLDAHSAFQIIQTLKNLARSGRNVIISIHAPRSEIWSLLDRVVLLSKGGTLYSGPANGAVSHFKDVGHDIPPFVNPAEFLVDLAAIDGRSAEAEQSSLARLELLKSAWKAKEISDLPSEYKIPTSLLEPHQGHAVRFRRQLMVTTGRNIKTTLRDPMGMAGCIMQSIIMALVYGWVFFKLGTDEAGIRSREGAIYVALYQSYLMLMLDVYRLTVDIRLFDMERSDGVVGVPAFLLGRRLAKVLEDLPIPIIFCSIFYFMVGLRSDPASFGIFVAISVASHYSAVTLACLCVALSRDFAVSSLIANLIFTIQFLSCGWVVQAEQLPVYLKWLRWISYNFYGFMTLTLNEFMGSPGSPTRGKWPCPISNDASNPAFKPYTSSYIIETLGFSSVWLLRGLGISFCFAFVFLATAGLVLTISKKEIGASRIKNIGESSKHEYGNPIRRPMKKVPRVVLSLQDHTLEVRTRHLFHKTTRKVILNPMSVSFEPRKINVIMGPSGSGKTSLLRSLSRKLKNGISTTYDTSGEITLNGLPASTEMIKSTVSFVSQDDDALMPALTVRETLRYAAGIRLPPSMSKEEKIQRAEDLIIQMGLGHCADHFVGGKLKKGISGGEKRRVSIAIQILADPLVLLLDEPTSGLDVWTASSVLDVLRALADEGRTIIMTAHQCRSDAFESFDRVLLLTRGGSVAYSGDGGNILPHFSTLGFDCGLHTNPADFILDLITVDLQRQEREDLSRRRVGQLLKVWENAKCCPTVTCTTVEEPESEMKDLKQTGDSFLNIFTLVLKRSALNISRNQETVIARTSNVIGMAIVFALFFSPLQSNAEAVQTRMGFIQIATSFCIIGMLQNVAVYPTERDIFYREFSDNCYGVLTFLTSYTILELPFNLLSSLIFGILAAFAINLQRSAFMFAIATINCFCIVSCGESLGIVFCTFFSSHIGLAMHASSALFSIGATMAGIVTLKLPPVLHAVNYISPFKYLVANMAVYSLRGRVFTCAPDQEVGGRCPISSGEDVLRLYDLDTDPRWNLVVLAVLAVFYRLVALVVVKASRMEWKWRFLRARISDRLGIV
ncbi:ABC efflux transporter [Hyaloscypha variabilis]